MDPTGSNPTPPPPDQQPGWGQPAPGQPSWGQPAPGQPAPGQPGWGQPAPGQQVPGQPGWGQPPAWGVAPVPQKRGRSRLIGIVIGIVVVLGVIVVAAQFLASGDPNGGKVTFSTSSGSASTCAVSNEVTSVKAGVPVYATYHFKSRTGANTLSMSIDKDGVQVIPATSLGDTDTKQYDCVSDSSNLAQIFQQPGTYKITIYSNGTVVSEGTLTVTP